MGAQAEITAEHARLLSRDRGGLHAMGVVTLDRCLKPAQAAVLCKDSQESGLLFVRQF